MGYLPAWLYIDEIGWDALVHLPCAQSIDGSYRILA